MTLSQLKALYDQGRLDRRSFVCRAMLQGLSAAAAYALLGELAKPSGDVAVAQPYMNLDRAEVEQTIQLLTRVATAPALLDRIMDI